MAKFKGKELILADGQRIIFGTGSDSHIWWDDIAQELRLDTTISGVDPVQDYQLTTKFYVDSEVDTLSGTIPYHHDQLIGLGDDDHIQYVPTDGSRGFTATVSGVDPTQSYHLTTKAYVDSNIISRKGRQSIADGASHASVGFTDFGHTNFTVNATLSNTVDSPPSIYAFIVSSTTTSGFNVTFMGDMDSSNYILHWTVVED